MPEGPSLYILREKIEEFAGRTVQEASGLRDIDYDRITGHKLLEVKTWGSTCCWASAGLPSGCT